MSKSIYDLKLNECVFAEDINGSLATSVMRVPGGWIYRCYDKGHSMMSATFVRFDNEFQETIDLNDTNPPVRREDIR